MIYVTAARRLQAQATADAIGAGWRAVRRGLIGLAGLARRHLLEPLARRAQRRRAHADLAAMDDRLLADIGLRRGDIQLALAGRLADPRVTSRAPASTRQQPPPPTAIDAPRRRGRTGIPIWRRKRSPAGHGLDHRRGQIGQSPRRPATTAVPSMRSGATISSRKAP